MADDEIIIGGSCKDRSTEDKHVLLTNREFLTRTTVALIEKETLLYSDIKALRESVSIVDVDV